MKIRKSFEQEVPELEKAITLSVFTKVPLKWILIDTETLQVYKGTNNKEIGKQWKKISSITNIEKFRKSI